MHTLAAHLALSLAAVLALSACGSNSAPAEKQSSEADDFAARINGGDKTAAAPPQVAATVAPQVVPAAEGVAPGPFAAGTATDPNSACNANRFASFLGQTPSAEVRAQIMEAAGDISEVRFIAPGSDYIKPDPTNPRLNLMIAVDGVIRDIRCG